jgi:hypothetical protein
MNEDLLLPSHLHHLLLSNLLAPRLQKLRNQPHRGNQIPLNIPHRMRYIHKRIRSILEPKHLFQNIVPLGPLREVDQTGSREVPIVRGYGVWVPVVDLRDLRKPHPDVWHTGTVTGRNGGPICGKSVCRASEGQEFVEDSGLGNMSPGLVQARDDVA